jgi:hypothetical protein
MPADGFGFGAGEHEGGPGSADQAAAAAPSIPAHEAGLVVAYGPFMIDDPTAPPSDPDSVAAAEG